MILILTLLIILFITICGYSVINLCKLKTFSWMERMSYSWGLGVGLISVQLFLYSTLNIDWSRTSILTPWAPIIFISFWKNRPKFKLKIEKTDKFEKMLLLFIIGLISFTAIESVIRPVQAWDGWSSWLLRPKVYFLENNISQDYVHYANNEYPYIVPLMSTFDYILIGQINDTEVLLLFSVFYLAIGLLFYSKAKEIAGGKIAFIFTFLLISSQNLIRHGGRFEAGQADLPLAFFILCSACLLLNFLKSKNFKNLFFLNLFLGFMPLIKNDAVPTFIIGNLMIIYYIFKSKNWKNIFSLIPSIFLFGSWSIYKYLNDYPKNFLIDSGSFHLNETFEIILGMIKEFFNFQNWNLLWVVFIFSVVIYYKFLRNIFPLFLLFVTQFIFYIFAFILSPYPSPLDHVTGIIDRLYVHIAPLAMLITVALISLNFETGKKYFRKLI